MDERGVDVHVVSAIPAVTPTGGADAQTALDLNRRYNDRIAAAVRDHPGRLVGSFTLPLQDLDLALAEMERAHGELGLGVIQLPANIDGVYLGESPRRPLWEEIAAGTCSCSSIPMGSATHGSPSTYLRRLYYDTCAYEPSALSALIAQVGADHLLMGSDWPVGEADPIGFVERCTGCSDDDRRAILGSTAAHLLRLS